MREWTPAQVAEAAGARLVSPPPTEGGPSSACIDSRQVRDGALFVGLRGANTDGGSFAPEALAAGAWGVLATPEHAEAARCARPGVLLAAEDPLRAMQKVATQWRRHLDAQVIGVTGSTGKTSTKDLLLALLAPQRQTVASRANFNTEIGLPLEILNAPSGTEVLVLEMAMRGGGQVGELAAIAEPDVGVIVNIGPVHLELLGSLEAIAAAKAELIDALRPGASAVVPAGEQLLESHLRPDLKTITFGRGGDVEAISEHDEEMKIDLAGRSVALEVSFTQPHLRRNLLAAVAAASAVGVTPQGRVELQLTAGRGQVIALGDGITLIDDCYNANPMSMRAALDYLATMAGTEEGSRRVAVLGDMLELGPDAPRFHEELGRHASHVGVDVLVTVGTLAAGMERGFDKEIYAVANAAEAAALLPDLLAPGDLVLVKASRAVGLELVCQTLAARVAC